MDEDKAGMLRFFLLFLLVKLVLGNLSDEQSTDIQDSTVWKRGKVKTGQKEVGESFCRSCLFSYSCAFLIIIIPE